MEIDFSNIEAKQMIGLGVMANLSKKMLSMTLETVMT
jgi:hypothetical protein